MTDLEGAVERVGETAFPRSRSFVLYPTPEQAQKFTETCGVVRLVYNLALEQRRDFWRNYRRTNGKNISHSSQCREVTQLRAEYDFIRAVSASALNRALRDLDRAYQKFFSGKGGYPKFRNKHEHNSYNTWETSVAVRKINAKWSEIRVPSIGWVKYRSTRPVDGKIGQLTIRQRNGVWTVRICCHVSGKPKSAQQSVGIDRGVANSIALSSGELRSLPAGIAKMSGKLSRAKKTLSRRKRGSARYAKQKQLVSRISASIARKRSDWIHRQSTYVASNFNHVALEKLSIKNMTASGQRKRGLNRSILHQGWGIFASQLAYKVEERAGLLVFVNPAYSSQTCSACGAVDAENRKSQAVFRCVTCGHEGHADVEAAKEILRRSTAPKDVEGLRRRPVEALTKGAAS